jgi:hypothetical protein
MAIWTHNICGDCWNRENPTRAAARLTLRGTSGPNETCCFCGKENTDGIFIREDPDSEKLQFCKHKEEA